MRNNLPCRFQIYILCTFDRFHPAFKTFKSSLKDTVFPWEWAFSIASCVRARVLRSWEDSVVCQSRPRFRPRWVDGFSFILWEAEFELCWEDLEWKLHIFTSKIYRGNWIEFTFSVKGTLQKEFHPLLYLTQVNPLLWDEREKRNISSEMWFSEWCCSWSAEWPRKEANSLKEMLVIWEQNTVHVRLKETPQIA